MVRPWVGWLCILLFITTVFYLYLSINAPIIKNPYLIPKNTDKLGPLDWKLRDFNKLSHERVILPNITKSKDCSPVHIAIVCAGYDSTIAFANTLKSIIFYRSRPLHFHLLVDEISLRSLNVLLNTWAVPEVAISYYRLEGWISTVEWIPNSHYSGVYGLLKLTLPDIIKEKRVLVLDIDVTVLNDISLLWDLFNEFNQEQAIGLVENQSNWYLKPSQPVQPWPALRKGFNTGIMLMDLQLLREKNFKHIWKSITVRVLKDISKTSLADQDVINAVIKYNSELLFEVDCLWNVQLSDHSLSEICLNKKGQVNIIHWNSPRKLNVRNRYAQDFKKTYQIFLELDGNLLRQRLIRCQTDEELSQTSSVEPCHEFYRRGRSIYRTHIFYLEFEHSMTSSDDILLATQCSFDRITFLEDLSKHWLGPISVALYLTDAEVQSFLKFFGESDHLRNRKNIAYHIVYKEGDYYPVNYLRNVAISHISFSYIFHLDIDFLPQLGLNVYLKNFIDDRKNFTESSKVALIIPAFETQRYRFTFPTSKEKLLKYLDLGTVSTFRYFVWPRGHAPTNFTMYRGATEPYEVFWEPDFEPFVVVPKTAPLFDTRFVGFGWNKVSFITHLAALGYRFLVLPDTFTIHRSHAPSWDLAKFRMDDSYRRCLKILKDSFVHDLIQKLGTGAVINLGKLFINRNDSSQNYNVNQRS
ncbi:hypothetical protein QAD02_012428 [Eretmocerus hayati]|uniref:Uncharacterized protein n=1 Tax=Eretmocerus hayati TaxID=131215 RepID=A0ACC2NZM8_9HYME|nr:hypothetical protein QAD02_012428 [Eretmocerus hayati]